LNHSERISGMGSWQWTPDTDELLWSDNHFRLFGMEPDAIVPTPELVVKRTHPDDRAFVEQTVRAMLADTYSGDELEYRIVGEDGVTRSLRMTVATLFDGERAARRIVGSVQDVTAQRRLDRQLAAHVAVTRSLDDWPSLEHGAVGPAAAYGSCDRGAIRLRFGSPRDPRLPRGASGTRLPWSSKRWRIRRGAGTPASAPRRWAAHWRRGSR